MLENNNIDKQTSEIITKINNNFSEIKESYKQKYIQSSNLEEIRRIFKVKTSIN